MRWFTLAVALLMCVCALVVGRIHFNRRMPTNVSFEDKVHWATELESEEISQAQIQGQGSNIEGYLKYGLNTNDESACKAESKRRLFLVESQAATPAEKSHWFGYAVGRCDPLERQRLAQRYTTIPDRINLLRFVQKSGGSALPDTDPFASALAAILKADSNLAGQDSLFQMLVGEYLRESQSNRVLMIRYHWLSQLVPEDQEWHRRLDYMLLSVVPRELYLSELTQLVLKRLEASPEGSVPSGR